MLRRGKPPTPSVARYIAVHVVICAVTIAFPLAALFVTFWLVERFLGEDVALTWGSLLGVLIGWLAMVPGIEIGNAIHRSQARKWPWGWL